LKVYVACRIFKKGDVDKMESISATAKNNLLTEQQLRDSIATIVKASDPKGQKEITDLSRVNEQHMFAAIVHGRFNRLDPKQGQRFEEEFKALLPEQTSKHPGNHIFEAARIALKNMRLAGEITRGKAVRFRHFALGKSQLDSKLDELSTKNVTGKDGDTAVRAVKTAILKFTSNNIASQEEMKSFRDANIDRRGE
jgi:hypothetical protein